MHRILLTCTLIFGAQLFAQSFDPITTVCKDGPLVLTSPVQGVAPENMVWETSFDGGGIWRATGGSGATFTVKRPQTGVSFRVRYLDPDCRGPEDCNKVTNATKLVVDLPIVTQRATICGGSSVTVGDTSLSETGIHRIVLDRGGGCDSVVTTFLNVKPSSNDLFFVYLCPGELFEGKLYESDTILADTFQNSQGCDSIVRFELEIAFAGENIGIDGGDIICIGDVANLSVPTFFNAYRWNDGSTEPSLEVTDPGIYTVTITDAFDCSLALSDTLEFAPVDIIATDLAAQICPGTATGSLSIQAEGAGPLLYAINGGAYQTEPVFTDLQPGTYNLQVENVGGCVAVDTVVMPATDPLHIFDPNDRIGFLRRGDTLLLRPNPNFRLDSVSYSPAEYLTCTNCGDPYAFPPFTTEFVARTTSPLGCEVVDSFRVEVNAQEKVFAPTAFSPNGDRNNDRWRLFPGLGIRTVNELSVYDRWGRQVYRQPEQNLEPDDRRLGWDGTDGREPLPTGAYFYTALVRYNNSAQAKIGGVINLIR